MSISTSFCGLALGQRETVLTTRRMLAYAAGIGDLAPRVFDDLDPGFMAQPAICVALEWPLISDPAVAAQLLSDPREAARAVHLTQDSHFHRPLRALERLTTSGAVTGVWRGAAGVRVASTLHTCGADGVPAVTSHTVAVYRGVEAVGADRPAATAPEVPQAQGLGEAMHSAEIVIERALAHRYTECSGIWNPIHTERRVARAMGLPDPVLHGTATWAMAGAQIVQQLAGSDASRLKRLHGRFGALVFPGCSLSLQWRARPLGEQTEVFFAVLTPDGTPAIADGYALLAP